MKHGHRSRFLSLAVALASSLGLAAQVRADPEPPCHASAPPAAAATTPVGAATEVRLEEVSLLDQHGARVRFKSDVLADKLVVMDFVFTRCTTICPVLSAGLARVQEKLGERLGKEVRLVSVSIDPANDTPERLAAYAARHKARDGWVWLTGEKTDVQRLLTGLSAYVANPAEHAPFVLVGDPRRGTWLRLNGFPDPAQVVARLDELAAARRGGQASAAGGAQP